MFANRSARAWGFEQCTVLVLGDVMLDEYLEGEARRLSPEAPVPIVQFARKRHVAGGAANVALNIDSLGGDALLAGVAGQDNGGVALRILLESRGVDVSGIQIDETRPTTTKTRILAGQQQLLRLDLETSDPLSDRMQTAVLDWALARLPEVDVCVLSDYSKGLVTERVASTLIATAQQLRKPIIVDPKGRSFSKYSGATVITPNLHELEAVVGQVIASEAALAEAGRRALAELGGSALLVTRGPQGMSLFREGRPPLYISACAREVFDPCGAGDTVVAVLALGLARGMALEEAVTLANTAAGIVVGKRGTTTVSVGELSRFWDSSGAEPAGTASRNRFPALAVDAAAQSRGPVGRRTVSREASLD